jgi:malonate decarboxylase delta subunit
METLQFRFGQGSRPLAGAAQLVGVVGSGNLEVLIEAVPLDGACGSTSTPPRSASAPPGRR